MKWNGKKIIKKRTDSPRDEKNWILPLVVLRMGQAEGREGREGREGGRRVSMEKEPENENEQHAEPR